MKLLVRAGRTIRDKTGKIIVRKGQFQRFDGRKNQIITVKSNEFSYEISSRGLNKKQFNKLKVNPDKLVKNKTVYNKKVKRVSKLFSPRILSDMLERYQTREQERYIGGHTVSLYLPLYVFDAGRFVFYMSYVRKMIEKFSGKAETIFFGLKATDWDYDGEVKTFGVYSPRITISFESEIRRQLSRILERMEELLGHYKTHRIMFQISLQGKRL